MLHQLPKILDMNMTVPSDYANSFVMAMLTFKHQTVFNVKEKRCIPLTPWFHPKPADTSYLGEILADDVRITI